MSEVTGEGGIGGASAYRPQSAILPEALPHVKSRWAKGTLTFGPVGRICWTIGIVLVPIMSLVVGSGGGLLLTFLWSTTVAPLALRDIWARETVYVPIPPIAPLKSLTMYDGTPIKTLEEYVAEQAETRLE
jgi:hypothetical protein